MEGVVTVPSLISVFPKLPKIIESHHHPSRESRTSGVPFLPPSLPPSFHSMPNVGLELASQISRVTHSMD